MDLTDAQWALLEPLLREKRRPDGRGRPWRDSRPVLNGVLWVLRTGAPWQDLPERYPPYQTCHRRFQRWVRHGTLTRILEVLAEDLRDRGGLDVSEVFIDASFSSFLPEKPQRLIGDRAYDSDPLDEHLQQQGIEMIAPHQGNRKHTTQDGRPLRRYQRRWKIERLFAWLHNFRRLVTRYEYHAQNFLGFLKLACCCILLWHL